MNRILEGKVAIITGGTRGLGLAIAEAYLREGAAVVIGSRSDKSVKAAMESLHTISDRVVGCACDVGSLANVQALAQLGVDTFGHFDVWVNNAGISPGYGPTAHIPPQDFAAVIQTNILGMYYGSTTAMQHFLPRGSGKLINLLGNGDKVQRPLQNAYGSSKTWARQFTLTMSKEYKGSGVEVIAFNPGLVDTDLLRQPSAIRGYEKRLEALKTVIRLWANPPEVPAQKAVWLASSATDGRSGLEIQMINRLTLLSGLAREGVRRLTGKRLPPIELQVSVIEPTIPIPQPVR
jgi:NAD(P)-dependent dehydrogenase (short-subunit alcohol dehydrogenase family)